MKLSIIIPAYNVADYVGLCLDSIFQQNINPDNYEVICINDGSTDQTAHIIEQYSTKHPNLIYISRENKGLAATRNEGLSKATGDLIWYVDSDDTTSSNSIKQIIYYFNQYPNADFLIFDDIHFNLTTKKQYYIQSWVSHRLFSNNLYEIALNRENGDRLKSAICQLFVYKRDYLINHDLFFLSGIIHEDDEIRMRMFFFAKEIRYIPYAHYIYTLLRPGSITAQSRTPQMKSIQAIIKTIDHWNTFKKKYAQTNQDYHFINRYTSGMYAKLLRIRTAPKDSEQYHLYEVKKNEWKKAYIKYYFKSISLTNFSIVKFCKFIKTLLSTF